MAKNECTHIYHNDRLQTIKFIAMKCKIIIGIILIPFIGITQKNRVDSYPIGKTIEVYGQNYKGYIFDNVSTSVYMSSGKRNRFVAYWWLDECTIDEIELHLNDYVNKNYNEEVSSNLANYIRQYFPFINKDGDLIIRITLSLLEGNNTEKSELVERIKKYYRSIFDGDGVSYFSVQLNYSEWKKKRTF